MGDFLNYRLFYFLIHLQVMIHICKYMFVDLYLYLYICLLELVVADIEVGGGGIDDGDHAESERWWYRVL